ncbi:MAG: glycosyltransferase family A protein [Rhodocyclales bacterium]|nr:glycosyltransferase family A protein [Rhodocyclales bacterium]
MSNEEIRATARFAGAKVSVVIPCYNTHEFLGKTLDSVRAQTYSVDEIILVDDGSTNPSTIHFLDHVGDDVRLVRQQNKGLPAARNVGFGVAKGDYVLPLDADDWLEPSAVEKLLGALTSQDKAAFSFCQMYMEGDGQGVLAKNYNFFEQLFLNQLPYCLMLKKSAWEAVGGYDETMRRGYEDWEFNIRLGSMGYFGLAVAEPLFHYRIAQSGMLLSTSNKVHGELWASIRQRHPRVYGVSNLFHLWRHWRTKPSTYPLFLYFFWLTASRLLPTSAFATLFRALRRYSHGRRVTASASKA